MTHTIPFKKWKQIYIPFTLDFMALHNIYREFPHANVSSKTTRRHLIMKEQPP